MYIGQTTQYIKQRWLKHCDSHSGCIALRRAIKRYGKNSFTIEILETTVCRLVLNYKEQEYIKQFNTLVPNGYNITNGGSVRVMTPELIKRIAAANTGKKRTAETKLKMRIAKLGKKLSQETRKKMSLAALGRSTSLKGRPWSPARRAAQESRNNNGHI